MHVAEPLTRIDSTSTAIGSFARATLADARSLLGGRFVLVAIMAGVTWLALIGATLGLIILREGGSATPQTRHGSSRPGFVVYELGSPVPTTFGSVTVNGGGVNGIAQRRSPVYTDDPDEEVLNPDKVQLEVSVLLSNDLDQPVDAPRLDSYRVVSTFGNVADFVPALSSSPGVLSPHSTATVSLTYLAPEDGTVLWLEYRERPADRAVRVGLGWADEIPQHASAPVPVPAQADIQPAPSR